MDFSNLSQFPETNKNDWNAFVTNGVSHVPFLRYDYLQNWWRTRGGGEWKADAQLVIVTASENGRLMGIAPCFVTEHEGKKALMFLGSIEISDYLDFLVRPQHLGKFAEGFLSYARTVLAPQYGIQIVDLYNIVDKSPTVRALQNAAASLNLDCQITSLVESPYIPLSGDWEGYLNSIDKKQRHEIRRKMRRMDELKEAAGWYIASDADKIDSEIQDFIRLMAFDEEKQKFLTPAMKDQMASLMREAFDNGLLQLAFQTVNGEKAAAYLNFDYLNRIWVYNSGFDPRFNEFSPGWVLLGHLLQWANENNRFEFDFMRGNEEYKYRFGAIDRAVVRAAITL